MNRFPNARRSLYALLSLAMVTAMLLGGCDPRQLTTPPNVIGLSPTDRSVDVAPTTPVRITFDQSMDKESVARALGLSPATSGSVSWDGNTFVFAPHGEWQAGEAYVVTLSTTARNSTFRNLEQPVRAQFTVAGKVAGVTSPPVGTPATAGTLAVSIVQPANDTTEVAVDNDLLVQFSRPMVPLTTLDSLDHTSPFSIEPAVAGTGKWLNTAIYTFRPQEPLAPATRYRVTIPQSTADVDGNTLSADYTWVFTTVLPAVSVVYPRNNSQWVGPTDAITVTFNQPMNRPSVQEHLTLQVGTQAVAGRFFWRDDQTVAFYPADRLALSATYIGRVAAGAQGANGAPMPQPYEWLFRTVGQPTVKQVTPSPSATDVDYYDNVRVIFSNPMDRASVNASLTIVPTVTQVYSYWVNSNTEWSISPSFNPSTRYTVTFGQQATDRYALPLDREYHTSFTTRSLSPWTYLYKSGNQVFFPAGDSIVVYAGHRNTDKLEFALYKMGTDTFRTSANWYYGEWKEFKPDPADLLREWSMPVAAPLNKTGAVSTTLDLEPGLYFLRVHEPQGDTLDQIALAVSRYQLTLKRTTTEALVWAGELDTGDVAPDLPITFYDDASRVLGTATTDSDGVAQVTFSQSVNPYQTVWAMADEAQFGVVSTGWNEGLEGWSFNLPINLAGQPYRAFLYTDRSIYRPGQTVYFRGVVRADDDGTFSVPRGQSVPITIYDDQGRKLLDEKVTLDEFGAFDGQLALGDEAALGYYRLEAQLPDPARPDEWHAFAHSFSVAEYRKPEFAATVQTDHDEYIHDDSVNLAVDAQYYFGAPVVGGKVSWRVMTESYYFTLPEEKAGGWYSFTDADDEWAWDRPPAGQTEIVTEGTGQTDEQGQYLTQFRADISQKTASQQFTIEASVVDLNNQVVSNRTTAIIHRGLFYVGLRPDRYVGVANQAQTIHVLTVDPQGEPMPNEVVDVSFYQRKWYSVRQKDSDGTFYWTWTHTDTLVMTDTVTMDAGGRATAVYTPTVAGSYRIVASALDERGNTIRSAAFQWITGREFVSWRMEDHDRIDLVADQREYQPGDEARILVPSPYRDAQLLVSIERGHLISHQVLTQTSNSMLITVPVQADYVPNVYVSVVVLKRPTVDDPAPGFKVGYTELEVSAIDKVLQVTLTPDQATYGPRDKATYHLQALNAEGLGVYAEFSLALVDKSVLALVDDTTGSILDAFYGHRDLGVETSGSLVVGLEHVNLRAAKDADAGGKGGGGGKGEGLVRSYFPDVAYWNAHVITDRSGEATVTVDLPDNLTTWQMRALGVTGPDTLVGDATAEIVTRKSLLVRPALPRFLVVSDKARLLALVHNYTEQPLTVDVTLTAAGVTIKDTPTQRVTVPANGAERVTWDVVVGTDEQVTVQISAQPTAGGAESDAARQGPPDVVELTLPVYRYSTPETVATAGQLDQADTRTELIRLPQGIDASQGELTVKLDPSLAASMRDGLTYLRDFPYMCVEQTVSRFLPNVTTYRALTKLGVRNEDLEKELPGLVNSALQRLYKYQNSDGGWGWWQNEHSQPWITAYALHGMYVAQEAGLAVDDGVMERATDYLRSYLSAKTDARANDDANTRAYVLYVLAETGAGDLGRTLALYESRDTLAYYGQGFLLLTLAQLAKPDDPRVQSLVSDLSSAAIVSATGAHWEESSVHYWTMNTNNRTTSIVLDALVRADPQNPLIPNTVRWLMVSRQEGHWETTQETAFAVLALTDVMLSTGELEADYTYRVALNAKTLTERTVNKANVGDNETLVIKVSDLLIGETEANRLAIERLVPTGAQTGRGKLWYSAYLRYFLPAQEVLARSQGIGIAREYLPYGASGDELVAGVRTSRVGDVIQVKLTIMAPNDLHYLVVEDWLPAGFEAVDTSLKTTSQAYQGPTLSSRAERWWWRYVNSTALRDEKTVLFATYLPAGTYEYTYLIRATTAGEFRTIPTTASEMYFPEVWGRSDGGVFTVTP
ncbi:MAG: Ig-like domain-containing protein [Chloroflexi bacterium]|nr:Ig-like domain-containing protein [Chloroflexota bacterium]MBU1749425.1 Ig-like domain-containing protein [Chloroflexota bacterium]